MVTNIGGPGFISWGATIIRFLSCFTVSNVTSNNQQKSGLSIWRGNGTTPRGRVCFVNPVGSMVAPLTEWYWL